MFVLLVQSLDPSNAVPNEMRHVSMDSIGLPDVLKEVDYIKSLMDLQLIVLLVSRGHHDSVTVLARNKGTRSALIELYCRIRGGKKSELSTAKEDFLADSI